MTLLLLVMAGAAVGAPCRWKLDQLVQARHTTPLPWGTFTVNMLGSVLLGILMAMSASKDIGPHLLALLGTGFCGGFTTYSTFGFESVKLAEEGSASYGLANAAGSVVLGVLAAGLGWWIGSQIRI